MDFLKKYRKMISFRGLTEHTITAYSTYITAYLEYIDNKLHKYPSQVTYNDIRRFLDILQAERGLSDRTINCAIAQIRFFTMYVLHKPWDSTQVPTRRFDTYLPYVPSQEDANYFIESVSTSVMEKTVRTVMPSSRIVLLRSSQNTGMTMDGLVDGSFLNSITMMRLSIPFISRVIYVSMRTSLDGNINSPVIHSAMLLEHISMRMAPISWLSKNLWGINPLHPLSFMYTSPKRLSHLP